MAPGGLAGAAARRSRAGPGLGAADSRGQRLPVARAAQSGLARDDLPAVPLEDPGCLAAAPERCRVPSPGCAPERCRVPSPSCVPAGLCVPAGAAGWLGRGPAPAPRAVEAQGRCDLEPR